jgi:hypothetical protein
LFFPLFVCAYNVWVICYCLNHSSLWVYNSIFSLSYNFSIPCSYYLSSNDLLYKSNFQTLKWSYTFFFLFLLCCVGVHCGIYKSSYNISYLNSLPPSFSLPSPIPGIVSTGHFSIYTHICTVVMLFSPPMPFPHLLPPPIGTNLPRQDLFYLPVLQFCKLKKMTVLFI